MTQSPSPDIPPISNARCPRCGYDQRGPVATWKEQCPLQGTCSECGLVFNWAEVFNPRLYRPTWCVEYSRLLALPWRAVTTMAMSLWPWRFWWALQMHHEPRWARIACYLLIFMVGVWLVPAIKVADFAYQQWQEYDQQVEMNRRNAAKLAAYMKTQQSAYIPTSRVSMPQAVAHAVFMPWSDSPSGSTVFEDGSTQPYPRTPRFIIQNSVARKAEWLWSPMTIKAQGFPFLLSGLIAASFVLLPLSRRVSKVRWRHVVRIALYGLAFCVLSLIWTVYVVLSDGGYATLLNGPSWSERAFVSFVVVPIILFFWWSAAISRHLRMAHAWSLSALLIVLSYLLLLLLGYLQFLLHARADWFIW